MLFALVVMMAGVLLLVMVVNTRRQPSRWEGGRATDWSSWAYGGGDGGDGGDSGADCSGDAGGGDDGGGGGD